MAGNIKSGVKIFNVTGSLSGRSTVSAISLTKQSFTVSGQQTLTNPTLGSPVLMGTISLSSPPICIYLKGCNRNATGTTLSDSMYSFDGTAATNAFPTSMTFKGVLGAFDPYYNGAGINAITYFPTLDMSVGPGTASNYTKLNVSGIISAITSQTNTPFTWKNSAYSGTSSSQQYVCCNWTLHFSSDLKTGYIYATPLNMGVPGPYWTDYYATTSITSPTSITFGAIALA